MKEKNMTEKNKKKNELKGSRRKEESDRICLYFSDE